MAFEFALDQARDFPVEGVLGEPGIGVGAGGLAVLGAAAARGDLGVDAVVVRPAVPGIEEETLPVSAAGTSAATVLSGDTSTEVVASAVSVGIVHAALRSPAPTMAIRAVERNTRDAMFDPLDGFTVSDWFRRTRSR